MAYLDVITLDQAKNYLRIDDTLTEDDARITRIIKAALAYIEKATNVLVYKRNKTYVMTDGFIRVYDFPINDYVTPATVDDFTSVEQKTNYRNLCYGIETSDLVLDVGITLPADVPEDLVEVAYEIIDLMYYEHETGKAYTKDLTELSKQTLQQFKRFML